MPETTNIKAALEKTTQQKMPEGADEQFIGGLTMFFNREVEYYAMEKIPGLRTPKCYHAQQWVIGIIQISMNHCNFVSGQWKNHRRHCNARSGRDGQCSIL